MAAVAWCAPASASATAPSSDNSHPEAQASAEAFALSFALAVIPDAAYDVCRGAIVGAHKRHVMVVGYAMALPYLLTLYQLHLQFARTVDMEKLQSALIDVERHLDTLESVLENKLQRAVTMLQNAYGEGKQVSARIRASTQSVQVAETAPQEISAGRAQGAQISTDSGQLELVEAVQ